MQSPGNADWARLGRLSFQTEVFPSLLAMETAAGIPDIRAVTSGIFQSPGVLPISLKHMGKDC